MIVHTRHSFHAYNILTLSDKIKEYQAQLFELEEMGKKKGIRFLNPPSEILQLLDKVACKEKLEEHHVAVTTMVAKNVKDYTELKERMVEKKLRSVFLKPVYGSGAAGIVALSMNPVNRKVVAWGRLIFLGYFTHFWFQGDDKWIVF